jgi:hypothetical protein
MLQNLGERERERLAREAVRKALKNVPALFEKETSQRYYRARMEEENIEKLVDLARDGDKGALEFVQQYVSGLRKYARESGLNVMQLPQCVTELALEILTDGPPKTKTGPDPRDTALRNRAIAVLVDMVNRDYGFPEYRNIEHRGQKAGPISACFLVADEMGLRERWVEEIWAEHKEAIHRRRHSPR